MSKKGPSLEMCKTCLVSSAGPDGSQFSRRWYANYVSERASVFSHRAKNFYQSGQHKLQNSQCMLVGKGLSGIINS